MSRGARAFHSDGAIPYCQCCPVGTVPGNRQRATAGASCPVVIGDQKPKVTPPEMYGLPAFTFAAIFGARKAEIVPYGRTSPLNKRALYSPSLAPNGAANQTIGERSPPAPWQAAISNLGRFHPPVSTSKIGQYLVEKSAVGDDRGA
jgi:hypothetical protein